MVLISFTLKSSGKFSVCHVGSNNNRNWKYINISFWWKILTSVRSFSLLFRSNSKLYLIGLWQSSVAQSTMKTHTHTHTDTSGLYSLALYTWEQEFLNVLHLCYFPGPWKTAKNVVGFSRVKPLTRAGVLLQSHNSRCRDHCAAQVWKLGVKRLPSCPVPLEL